MERQFFVYILTNKVNTVLYTGVTNDLKKRIFQHRGMIVPGFTKRYQVTKLVYYEVFFEVENAIIREKRIKGGSRKRKMELIDDFNPHWEDLYERI
jgi:putative endonuclease